MKVVPHLESAPGLTRQLRSARRPAPIATASQLRTAATSARRSSMASRLASVNLRPRTEPSVRAWPTLPQCLSTAPNTGQQTLLAKRRTAHCVNVYRPSRARGRQLFVPFTPTAPLRACQPSYLPLPQSNRVCRPRLRHLRPLRHHHHPNPRRQPSPFLYPLPPSFPLTTQFFHSPPPRPI